MMQSRCNSKQILSSDDQLILDAAMYKLQASRARVTFMNARPLYYGSLGSFPHWQFLHLPRRVFFILYSTPTVTAFSATLTL